MQPRGLGILTLVGAQIDSVIVPSLPADIVFDVAVRLVGLSLDFKRDCDLEVTLTAPTWEELGKLNVPIQPRTPDWTHLPGSEINYHVMTRIDFEAIEYGAHHLEFVLDGKTQPHANTALTVVEPSLHRLRDPIESKYVSQKWIQQRKALDEHYHRGIIATRDILDLNEDIWAIPAGLLAWTIDG